MLCYLQGKTLDASAVQLGIARSTLKTRVELGRALLRARLVRRGLGPGGYPTYRGLAGQTLAERQGPASFRAR